MARKPNTPKQRNLPPDLSLLSPEDRAALTQEARKSVIEEMTQEARDAYFDGERLRIRREQVPDEALVHVTIDLAPFAACVMIDGVQYFHGFTYEVPAKQQSVLLEQMARTWLHQDEIDGRSRFNAYRRPKNLTIGPRDVGSPTAGANGVVVANLD